jgi:hypothetical protein
MVNAATIPDKRALEPAERLTNVCAIMDNHTKKNHLEYSTWAIHSLLPLLYVYPQV